jgi:hypothetical protein
MIANNHSGTMSFQSAYIRNFQLAQKNFKLWQIENYVNRRVGKGQQEKLSQDGSKETINSGLEGGNS